MDADRPPPPESIVPDPIPRAGRLPELDGEQLDEQHDTIPCTPQAWSEFRQQFSDLVTTTRALAARVQEQGAAVNALREDVARHAAMMERLADSAEAAAQAARDAANSAIEVVTARETERHHLAELIARVEGLDSRCERRHLENRGPVAVGGAG